jgi:chaperone BCS1
MQELITMVENLSKTNPFLFGFLALSLGAVANSLRSIPRDIYRWLWRVFTCRIEISNHDPLFESTKIWLNEQNYSKKSRALVGTSLRDEEWEDDFVYKPSADILLTPAPGNHFFIYKRKLILLTLRRETQQNVIASSNRELPPPKETIELTIFTRNQAKARQLIKEIVETAEKVSKDKAYIYSLDGAYWSKTASVHRRPIESVILPENTAASILTDIKEFRESRGWYRDKGIPYHRGYLLHGIPGSGKTSLVSALSDELNLNLYSLNLASNSIYDESLHKIFKGMKPDSIILMEDIDAVFSGRENQSKSQVTFSGLLNAIDGVSSREGTILFMTTNHREKLDPALIRPGRIDVELYFGHASLSQIERMIERFYTNESIEQKKIFLNLCSDKEISMAQVQKHFLKYKDSLTDAIYNVEDMLAHKFEDDNPVEEEEDDENTEDSRSTLRHAIRGGVVRRLRSR